MQIVTDSLVGNVPMLMDCNYALGTTQNLKLNRDHYASWMVHLGGARLVLISLSLCIYLCLCIGHAYYIYNIFTHSDQILFIVLDYRSC